VEKRWSLGIPLSTWSPNRLDAVCPIGAVGWAHQDHHEGDVPLLLLAAGCWIAVAVAWLLRRSRQL
jgi:hypothetical protein